MLKKLFIVCLFSSLINPLKATIHEILVWNGYFQFMPNDVPSVLLGDTIQWLPLDPPTMVHTITSTNIPSGAMPFDQIWQAPADTFFQYIPTHVGLYEYECTPHVNYNMVGSFTVNGTPGIEEVSLELSDLVYPNPASNALSFKSNFMNYDFKIFDLNGSLVMNGISSNDIDISDLRRGVYHLILFLDKPKKIRLVIF